MSTGRKKDLSKEFYIDAKKLFLTYPITNISKKEVLKNIKKVFKDNLQEYIIAQEKQLENYSEKNSIHIFIQLKKEQKVASKRLLLIDSKKNKFSGHYQAVLDKEETIEYVIKKDLYYLCSNKELIEEQLRKICDVDGVHKALEHYAQNYNLFQISNVKKNLFEYSTIINQSSKIQARYKVNEYQFPNELLNWLKNNLNVIEKKPLIVLGRPGWGKTEGLLTFFEAQNMTVRWVSDLIELADITNDDQILIIDEVDLTKLPHDKKISIFESNRKRILRINNKKINLHDKLHIVIVAKNLDTIFNSSDNDLKNRCEIINLQKPLIKNLIDIAETNNAINNIQINQISITNNNNIQMSIPENTQKNTPNNDQNISEGTIIPENLLDVPKSDITTENKKGKSMRKSKE